MLSLQLTGYLRRYKPSQAIWLVAQFALFDCIWLLTVIGQNPWAWLSATLLLLHFVLSPVRRQDLLVLPLALIGWAADGLLAAAGVFEFTVFPLWLGLLWFGFVLAIGHSLSWLRRLPWFVIALFGAVAGTGSYLTGWQLGAVTLPYSLWQSAVALALCWSLLLPLLVALDSKIRRIGRLA